MVAGVAAGAVIAAYAPAAVFKIAFVLIAGLIAIKMLSNRELGGGVDVAGPWPMRA